jgi:hypothetical protein
MYKIIDHLLMIIISLNDDTFIMTMESVMDNISILFTILIAAFRMNLSIDVKMNYSINLIILIEF